MPEPGQALTRRPSDLPGGVVMKFFDLLQVLQPAATPEHCKLHLASWNGQEHPLDVFLAGDFPEWQRWQSKRVMTQ